MKFTPALQPATLIKRYKRFLADVVTADGNNLTLHCANTGAMTGCATAGDTVWYSTSHNPARRYPHSWELTENQQGEMICINTLRANSLLREALTAGHIAELSGYTSLQAEVKYGSENSRIDFLLQAKDRSHCYIEVKSVTLLQQGQGYFPDAVTTRGQKHLRELSQMAQSGHRAVLFFAVMHSGITEVAPARHIDPQYAELLIQARKNGVELLCYKAQLSPEGMTLTEHLAIK